MPDTLSLIVVLVGLVGGLLGIWWRISAMGRERTEDRADEIKRRENLEYRLRKLEGREPWS